MRILYTCLNIISILILLIEPSQGQGEDPATEHGSQLILINKAISQLEAEINSIVGVLKDSEDTGQYAELRVRRNKLEVRRQSLLKSFREVAAGGLELDPEDNSKLKVFDWQAELLEIFKPVISSLKSMTARPREIEALKVAKSRLEGKVDNASSALAKISDFQKKSEDKALLEKLVKLERDWRDELLNYSSELKLVRFKLDELLNPKENGQEYISDGVKKFLLGRGLTISLAIGAFLFCYVIMMFISKFVESRYVATTGKRKGGYYRVVRITLQIMALLLALFFAVLVLYVRGDWVILAVIFLFLAAAAWGASQSLPKHVRILKILLNVGAVREGERVLYLGLPWQVSSISMYSTLSNPLLSGGELRLPIDQLAELISRPSAPDELWFPSERTDYVILDDGVYGRVIAQSPESVELEVKNSIKHYVTAAYLNLNPLNLSGGFSLFVNLRLNLDLQHKITNEIPDMVRGFIDKKFQEELHMPIPERIKVSFDTIGMSSFKLLVLASFSGAAAARYFHLERYIRSLLIEVCTENKWQTPLPAFAVDVEPITSTSSGN